MGSFDNADLSLLSAHPIYNQVKSELDPKWTEGLGVDKLWHAYNKARDHAKALRDLNESLRAIRYVDTLALDDLDQLTLAEIENLNSRLPRMTAGSDARATQYHHDIRELVISCAAEASPSFAQLCELSETVKMWHAELKKYDVGSKASTAIEDLRQDVKAFLDDISSRQSKLIAQPRLEIVREIAQLYSDLANGTQTEVAKASTRKQIIETLTGMKQRLGTYRAMSFETEQAFCVSLLVKSTAPSDVAV